MMKFPSTLGCGIVPSGNSLAVTYPGVWDRDALVLPALGDNRRRSIGPGAAAITGLTLIASVGRHCPRFMRIVDSRPFSAMSISAARLGWRAAAPVSSHPQRAARQFDLVQGNSRKFKAIQGNSRNSRQFKAIQGNSRQIKANQDVQRQLQAIRGEYITHTGSWKEPSTGYLKGSAA